MDHENCNACSDLHLALGSCTWVNMLIVLLLSPKVIALYKDYEEQMKAKKDPYYNPDKISWSGVDKEMWKDINKKYIENDKKIKKKGPREMFWYATLI